MDDEPQIDRFQELARELECQDEAAFEEQVRRVAKVAPPPSEPEAC